VKNSELIGVYLGTDYVFDNGAPDRRCIVGSIRLLDRTTVKVRGYANESEITDGITYRLYGHTRNHPKYGAQFNFNSFVEEIPADEDSILAYLETCRKPERGSITKRVALALFEAYGITAIDRLVADPVAASEQVKQWDAAKASIAAEYLRSQAGTQRCKLDLITLLNGRGFPKKTTDRAIKSWGAAAAKVIRDDPYELMSLAGIGFKGADKLYCDLAREMSATDEEYQEKLAAIHRQGLCAAHSVSVESRQSGSTWLPIGFAKAAVTANVSRTRATPDAAIEWAVAQGKLTIREGFIAVERMAFHELEIAEFITGSDDGNDWPSIECIEQMAPQDKPLSAHQIGAIIIATNHDRVGCLQGSPGVGKTFAVACIVKAIIHRFGVDAVAVAAPTGKAAVRVAQSMQANGVELPASTIHRLLQVDSEGSDGWTFHFNEQNPLPFRFIIADECFVSGTMIDTDLSPVKIEDVRPGQRILNAFGVDHVVAIGRKVASHVTKIVVGKKTIASSPSHRFFTSRGWVCASDIKPGDSIFQTTKAMRLLRDEHSSEESKLRNGSFLQSALLNEMVDAVPGFSSEDIHKRKSDKSRKGKKPVSEFRNPRSCQAGGQNQKSESNEQSIFAGCVFEETSGDWPQAISSGWEWERDDSASVNAVEDSWEWMAGRGRSEWMGPRDRISASLQIGSRKYETDDRDRNRRRITLQSEGESEGCQKGFIPWATRVDSVETYESASAELDQYRDAEGRIYLFDLQAARHKSYSVEGLLVHNCSMIDTDLLASLTRACTPSTHILLVGDTGQLAPVGHGRPFFDLQQVVPTGQLTEIRRNSGRIVKACAEIRDHRTITFSPKLDIANGENLVLIQCDDESQPAILEQLLAKLDATEITTRELNLVDDVQILTGKNDGSPVARKPLNAMLQKILNPNGEQIQGNPFRVSDKIVCLKNSKYPDAEDPQGEHFVANGELASAQDIKPGRMKVRVAEPPRSILITHAPVQENESGIDDSENTARGAVGDWDMGYALSVHRSQGSQWKFAIVMADSKGAMVQTRNWLYTAVSRAEIATFVIGQKQVVNAMLKRDGISGRRTFLVERICSQRMAASVDYDLLFAEV